MAIPDRLSRKLEALPDTPGVYLWKSAAGEILYVGKAKSLRARVPRDALRELPEAQAHAAAAHQADRIDVAQMPTVATSISVRGQTVDEALLLVDRYLDEAVRARLPQVTVIHGKGTGALRRALHDFLRGHPHVHQFRLGERGEGDSGATVVTLSL